MAAPIVGSELKVRAFELNVGSKVATDQIIAADGPTTGPQQFTPAIIMRDGTNSTPNGGSPLISLDASRMAVLSGPVDNPVAYVYSLADVMGGVGAMYLGPKSAPPVSDNFGQPLQPGHEYYNLNDGTKYIWSSAGKWDLSAAALPSVLRAYYYNFPVSGSRIPPNGPLTPDAFGKILTFDVSSEQSSLSGVNLFVNGVLLMNGVDYFVREGGASGDYIDLAEELCANSVAVVQVFASTNAAPFAASVKINTAGWVYDGRVTFPLVDMNNQPIVPNVATNCMISRDNQILEPNVGYTINADQITFASAIDATDLVWGVVGLPTSGAEGDPHGSRISPYQLGGVGDGATDDSDAVEGAINAANVTKATLDLSGGTWRITRQMPPLLYPRVDGSGSGSVYVDYQMVGEPVINCTPELGETYTVSAIATVTYDFDGIYSADSTVIRLTLTLNADQVMPTVGDIGKVTATDALAGVEAGDSPGQHLAVLATDPVNGYVYAAGTLIDTYTTGRQFVMLSQEAVVLRGFSVRGNWARVIAEDWIGSFIQILGARFPRADDVSVRDGPQGIVTAGCFMPQSRGFYAGRMRNATASESPPIPGYGWVDGGAFMPVHLGMDGYDCRHVYTTISPDAASWPRVAWGRTIRPLLDGGSAHACSAAAYDTHSDAWEPVFANLNVMGGYFGQNSAGAGIQFRGVRGTARNCHVRDTPVGFELYKQFAGELANHRVDGCTYEGAGTPLRAEHDPGLTGASARQTVMVGQFVGRSTGSLGIDLAEADLILDGTCKIKHTGAGTAGTDQRAVFERSASTIGTHGAGRLVYDISEVTAQTPRVITFRDASCGVTRLVTQVIAGSVAWQAWVSENEATAVASPAGAFKIDGDCDVAPNSVSGGYSQLGGSNLLPAGSLILRATVDGGRRQAAKTGAFTLNASHYGQVIFCNGTFTVTVPAVGVLGSNFECFFLVLAGTVTLDGPGGTNPTMAANSMNRLLVAGSAIYTHNVALTAIS